MTRRCSHCSNNGHNSRTCPSRTSASASTSSTAACGSAAAVKIFGVRLTDGSIIKKSASMGNLSVLHHSSSSSAAASPNPGSPSSDALREGGNVPDGYLSDDPAHGLGTGNRRGERKKGVPWTEEEHRLFLIGLQKLGKGDWRGIARNYVTSRTPTQVASHAQKYFIRQSNASRRKRRSSLFDMSTDMATDTPAVREESVLAPPLAREADNMASAPSLDLSLNSEYKSSEMSSEEIIKDSSQTVTEAIGYTPIIPEYFFPHNPVPSALWPANANPAEDCKTPEMPHHQVLKPIPLLPKEQPVNMDELVGISQLNLGEANKIKEPPPLSLKLLGEPSRQSAFHANAPVSASEGKRSPIQAV